MDYFQLNKQKSRSEENSSLELLSSHHVVGMLDRDQRTILTISSAQTQSQSQLLKYNNFRHQHQQQQHHQQQNSNQIKEFNMNNTKNIYKRNNKYNLYNKNCTTTNITTTCLMFNNNKEEQKQQQDQQQYQHQHQIQKQKKKTEQNLISNNTNILKLNYYKEYINQKQLNLQQIQQNQQQQHKFLRLFVVNITIKFDKLKNLLLKTVLNMPLNEFYLNKYKNSSAISVFKCNKKTLETKHDKKEEKYQQHYQHHQQHQEIRSNSYQQNNMLEKTDMKNLHMISLQQNNQVSDTFKCFCKNSTTHKNDLSNNLNKINSHTNRRQQNDFIKNRELKMNDKRKMSTKNLNKMKLSNLLFCILICLSVLVQRTYSKPMALNGNHHNHHIMQRHNSNGNNNKDDNCKESRCCRIIDSFDRIQKQANLAYDEIHRNLSEYVDATFNLTPAEQHKEWILTDRTWLHPNDTKYPKVQSNNTNYNNYTDKIPVEQLDHLSDINKQVLENELIVLFKRMKLIAMTARWIKDKIENENPNLKQHKYGRDHRSVQNYFETQEKMAKDVIKEVEYAFRQIGLQCPEIIVPNVTDKELQDTITHWVVTREHLKLLNYIRSAYPQIHKNDCCSVCRHLENLSVTI